MFLGAYDRRGSSITADIDNAIERMVEQYESSDSTLRLDVLRALSAQAQLAFETTRVRERLNQHPVSMDLIQGVTSQSLVYKTLTEKMKVDSYRYECDVERNVIMTTNVRWTLRRLKATKKRKKSAAAAVNRYKEMITKYRFERTRLKKEKEETLIKFSVVVAFGDDDVMPRELLCFEMVCEHPYPKSYYEDSQLYLDNSLESGDEERKKKKENENQVDEDQRDGEKFGEEQREFRFNAKVLADMGEWMGAGKLDPVDVVGFFMALPVHEDEWLVDERVCEILFRGGIGIDSSDEESQKSDREDSDDALEL